MKTEACTRQSGQALILVALALMTLLAVVALAVDAGHGYQERRRMQNAADAGALAGARELCFGVPSNAETTAEYYATVQNGADSAVVTAVGNRVTVTATIDAPTFVAQVLGIPSLRASAVAEAVCGCSSGGCGLWPITFNKGLYGEIPCNQEFLLWDDSAATCDVWDCGDRYPVPLTERAWVDLSNAIPTGTEDPCNQDGCGDSELKDRIIGTDKKTGQTCFSWVEWPVCLAGDSGVKADAWKEVENQRKIVRIPLYESINECTIPSGSSSACGTTRYWVTGAGCVEILGTELLSRIVKPPNDKLRAVVAKRLCPTGPGQPGWEECGTACGSVVDPDAPLEPGCLRTVSLSR